ncbi:MAG: tRNA 2-selenouridine(34) synthase MnmH [Burkholderiaceae bacterium]|jgi:tRNA 2-selenouridine synthase|nr:tRNA 2-selenouridine(34) synthase MnmH [Burkholderiaceae bacterium]
MEPHPISANDALADLARFDSIIDVRSASEFADDHVPGAINCPVLDDAERAQVGTLHKQASAFDARRLGAVLVARNIARHIESRFADRPRAWRPLVYCWRGGQRSGAMATVMARIGWPVRVLDGGYRGYRRAVVEQLALLPARYRLRVVCGTTGSGKSLLLQRLALAGAQVLDLEALACHRGSVLGGLPQQPQPTQKSFETRIWTALHAFDPRQPVFVESESRKVGDLRVPDALIERMRAAECIRLELPLAARVRLLRAEYAHYERDQAALFTQLDCLTALHGRERIASWKQLAQHDAWDELVGRLLVEHYDPAYLRSIDRNFARIGEAQVAAAASDDMADFDSIAQRLMDEETAT